MNKTVISEFKKVVEQFNSAPALYYRDNKKKFKTISYTEVYNLIAQFGVGIQSLGISRGDHIGLLSDNRKEWFIASMGIMGIGAADTPRGSDSTKEEFLYILNHAECKITLLENEAQLKKVLSIKKDLKYLKTIIIMDEEYLKPGNKVEGFKIYTFKEILDMGAEILKKDSESFEKTIREGKSDDLATLIYTSGTTGEPKGVMLTHSNFIHQIYAPRTHLNIGPTDITLSVLPVWHSFERTVEYFVMFKGCPIAYSKPLGKILLPDMEELKPTILPSVPRIWEAIKTGIYKKVNAGGGIKAKLFHFFVAIGGAFSKLSVLFRGLKPQFKKRILLFDMIISIIPLILLFPLKLLGDLLVFGKLKQKLGGRFRFGISGAGGLPPHVDDFYRAIGILILEGYGLTEAAPIVSVKKEKRPVPNTIGPLLPEMEMKILDKDSGKELPPGHKGILYVKGPNVMKGYYNRPEETAKVLSKDGWLNTGDLVMVSHKGDLKHMGREKETIALMGGENIEPGPIEDTILQSELIDQVMVVGHDQKYLGALVIPNMSALKEMAKEKGISFKDEDDLLALEVINELVAEELNELVNTKNGFKVFERVFKFTLLKKPFEPGVELTHSLKLKRNVIEDIYTREIKGLFK